jgi:hypothetical protein
MQAASRLFKIQVSTIMRSLDEKFRYRVSKATVASLRAVDSRGRASYPDVNAFHKIGWRMITPSGHPLLTAHNDRCAVSWRMPASNLVSWHVGELLLPTRSNRRAV